MSFSQVKIHYGPSWANFTYAHRPQKIKGLRDTLRRHGYRVDVVPVPFLNYCLLEVCGYEVFQCNIKNLLFNMPTELDPTCQRAVEAVLDATKKFMRARIYLFSWRLLEEQIFKRSSYIPKDHWFFEVDLKPMGMECTDCCGIRVGTGKAITETETESDVHVFPFE